MMFPWKVAVVAGRRFTAFRPRWRRATGCARGCWEAIVPARGAAESDLRCERTRGADWIWRPRASESAPANGEDAHGLAAAQPLLRSLVLVYAASAANAQRPGSGAGAVSSPPFVPFLSRDEVKPQPPQRTKSPASLLRDRAFCFRATLASVRTRTASRIASREGSSANAYTGRMFPRCRS